MKNQILTLFDIEPLLVEQPSYTPKKIKKQEAPKAIVKTESEIQEEAKLYLSIGDVARQFSVNNSLIRFWTQQFNIRVRTTRKGDRLYTKENVKQIAIIYDLVKQQGYTISGAKKALKGHQKVDKNATRSATLNQQILTKLISIQQQLLHLKDLL